MVRIVVDDGDAGDIVEVLEAAVHPTKFQQSLSHRVESHSEHETAPDRRERVLDVVVAGNAQGHVALWVGVGRDRERRVVAVGAYVAGDETRVRRFPAIADYLGA